MLLILLFGEIANFDVQFFSFVCNTPRISGTQQRISKQNVNSDAKINMTILYRSKQLIMLFLLLLRDKHWRHYTYVISYKMCAAQSLSLYFYNQM